MALKLLQNVAERALEGVSNAASSAFDYLSKNAPQAIDKFLQINPGTRIFSQQGQREVADVGRFLQKTPDTSFRAPLTPTKFLKNTPLEPIHDFDNAATEFITSIPGEFARSWGRTLERTGTPEGRAQQVEGLKQLPGQTKDLFTGGFKNVPQNLVTLFDNPAFEDVLNATDLFTLGAGTALKSSSKEAVEQTVKRGTKELFEQGAETVAKKSTREFVEQGTETAGKTILREAKEEIPTVLKKGEKVVDNIADDVAKTTVKTAQEAAPTKSLFERNPQEIAKRWINTREGFTNWRASDIKRNPALTQFDNEGINAFIELQSGKNPEKFKAIQDFTDGLFELEKKAGILEPEQYRNSYLPQMWDNTPEEIQQVFKNVVGKKPGFTKARILEDYATGIEAGLTPRYTQVSDLLESRFRTSQKALADREFVDNLVKTGNAKTLDKALPGWQPIDLKWEGKPIAVPQEIAQYVTNYTKEPSKLLERTARFVSEAKQTILSAGIPKTGWNFHTGVNVPTRAVAGRANPFGAVVDSVVWNFKPSSAVKYIDEVVPETIKDGLLKAGLGVSRSSDEAGYFFKPSAGQGTISKARTAWDRLFAEAAFDKILPAHKYKVGWETYQKAIKNGLSEDEAFRVAADAANTLFGGINPRALARDPDFSNMMRTILLAPDWLESNVRTGKNVGAALFNPANWKSAKYAPYRQVARNLAGMYASFAMLNKALSGHYPWQNDPGQEFSLDTGTFDARGRRRNVAVFGTALDFLRIPYQVVSGLGQGDPTVIARALRNRLSPPASAATSLFITGEDYRGRTIDTPGEVGAQVAQAVGVPSQITNTIATITGEQTPEELAYGLLEAPVRFSGGAKNPNSIKTAELLKSGGATNEEVNQAVSYKPENKGGLFSNLFGGGDGGNIKLPKSPQEKKAFDKSVDQALESGATMSEEVLRERFFDGNKYDPSSRSGQRDILSAMQKVAEDEYLTPEQKAAIANSAGINSVDLSYYRAASSDQEVRLEGLASFAAENQEDREGLIIDLVLGKRSVGGKSMFSTSMFDYLYDQGLISKDEKKLISAIKYDPVFNKFYMDRDYSGGNASQVKSYVKSVNSIFKDTIKKATSNIKTDGNAFDFSLDAPKINLPRTAGRSSNGSSDRWFTPY